MKKFLVLAAAAAVMFSSCSTGDAPAGVDKRGNAIDFRTVIAKSNRATETTINNIKDFKVFGKWSQSTTTPFEFMHNRSVVYNAATPAWEYAPLAYWPSAGTVDFYAYSPAGARGLTAVFAATATDPVVTYTVPINWDGGAQTTDDRQEDLLVARPVLAADKTTDQVAFTFDHALSQVVVQARSSVKDIDFNIEKVEITGLATSGTFDLSEYAAPAWTGWTVNTTAVADYNAFINSSKVTYSPDKYFSVSGEYGGLMLMPQEFAKVGNGVDTTPKDGEPDDYAADAETTYLVVTYNAQMANDGIQIVLPGSKVFFALNNALLEIGSGPSTYGFQMGKKYVFQLTMGASNTGVVEVKFDVAAVEDWVTTPVEL